MPFAPNSPCKSQAIRLSFEPMNDKDLPTSEDVGRLTSEIVNLRRAVIFGIIALAAIVLCCFGHSDIVLFGGAIIGIVWVAARVNGMGNRRMHPTSEEKVNPSGRKS